MKKTFGRILIGLFVLIQVTNCLGQKSGFTIKGNLKGLKNGTPVYLKTSNKNTAGHRVPDLTEVARTSLSDNGVFVFSGVELQPGQQFELSIEKNKGIILFPENKEQIIISGDSANWPNVKITGSQGTSDWLTYRKEFEALASQGNKTALDEYRMNFIKSKPNSLATVFIIFANNALNATEKQEAYNKLSASNKNSYFGKRLPKVIDRLKQLEPFIKSGSIPDFKVTGIDGKPFSIMDVVSKSKYTLIDFWASWCHPCRAGFPHVAELYSKYKDKGFRVIGISIDKEEKDWQIAMKEENTPWLNGRDNIEQADKNLFDIFAIPSLLIVDQNGKVVFQNMMSGSASIIRGDVNQGESDLDKKMEQLFKTK